MVLIACLLGAATAGRSAAQAQEPVDAVAKDGKPSDTSAPDAKKVAPTPAAEPNDKPGEQAESGPVRVRVERVKRRDLTVETRQPCDLAAGRTSVVYARVAGVVKRMAVEIGDRVKQGQALAELESLQLGPETEQAEAMLAEAKAEQQQAVAVNAEAEAKLAAAQADVEKSHADLETADVHLKHRKKQYERVKDLVQERSVDEKLADESEEKYMAAEAAYNIAKLSLEPAKALFASARRRSPRRGPVQSLPMRACGLPRRSLPKQSGAAMRCKSSARWMV